MSKRRILIQLDSDRHASSFDSVVAIDAGTEHLLTYSDVTETDVESLVHGAIFTRGADDLKSTALFVGGSDVEAAETIFSAACGSFFGPLRVSIMADPNGCNTTAAAAVLSARQVTPFSGKKVTVLGTGPVGQRIAKLIVGGDDDRQSASVVRIGSRSFDRAKMICQQAAQFDKPGFALTAVQTDDPAAVNRLVQDTDILFAAGAAGIRLVHEGWLERRTAPEVAVDLNAVPPAGLPGIDAGDKGVNKRSTVCYGAIGVGGMKMKIHRRCIQSLFERNDLTLDTVEIFEIGQKILSSE